MKDKSLIILDTRNIVCINPACLELCYSITTKLKRHTSIISREIIPGEMHAVPVTPANYYSTANIWSNQKVKLVLFTFRH